MKAFQEEVQFVGILTFKGTIDKTAYNRPKQMNSSFCGLDCEPIKKTFVLDFEGVNEQGFSLLEIHEAFLVLNENARNRRYLQNMR